MQHSSQGSLSKTSLPELLHLIYKKKDDSAALDIVREPVKKRIYFKNGIPVAATSNILNEVLGRLLLHEGIISQADYEASLEKVLKEKKRHGEVLVSMGLMTPERLEAFLSTQLKTRILRTFSWNEGVYLYTRTPVPANLTLYPQSPALLITEGIQNGFYPAKKANLLAKDLMDKKLKVTEEAAYSAEDFRLNLQEKRFLESFDGARTLKEILDSTDLLRHRAVSLACSFVMAEVIDGGLHKEPETIEEVQQPATAAEPSGQLRLNAELLFVRAKAGILRGEFREAAETLKEITEINPLEAEYWAYLGWALFNDDRKNLKEAEKVLKDSIDLNNELDTAWYFLGMVFLEKGDYEWAERAFISAHRKNQWMVEALSELKRLEARRAAGTPFIIQSSYNDFFGFREDPFQGFPAHPGLCFGSSQRQALEALLKSAQKGSAQPVLLTGQRGTGKTTLAIELLRRLSGFKVLGGLVLRPPDKELKLLLEINRELDALTDAQTVKDQLLSLGMRVSQNRVQGGSTLLIIDGAEQLTPGCLKLVQYLSRLKTLQIMLIGEPALAEALSSPDFTELNDKIKLRLELTPFTEEEIKDYILCLIKNASGESPTPLIFNEEVFENIREMSNGTAFEVNRTASRLLSIACERGVNVIDLKLLEPEASKEAPAADDTSLREGAFEEALIEPVFDTTETPAELAVTDTDAPPVAEQCIMEATGLSQEPVETEKAAGPIALDRPPGHENIVTEIKGDVPLETSKAEATEAGLPPVAIPQEVREEPLPKKKGLLKLVLLLALMVLAGLLLGSYLSAYITGRGGNQSAPVQEELRPPADTGAQPSAPPPPLQPPQIEQPGVVAPVAGDTNSPASTDVMQGGEKGAVGSKEGR